MKSKSDSYVWLLYISHVQNQLICEFVYDYNKAISNNTYQQLCRQMWI